jgi:uncharacterized protein YegJ (DUF2314 family)
MKSALRKIHVIRVIIAMALGLGAAGPGLSLDDRAIAISDEDQEMNQAIATARAMLPHFWKIFADPKQGEEHFNLKVKITDGEQVEHFWCTDIINQNGVISAEIGNEPDSVKTVKLGQRITIKSDDISDWLYFRDGKMIGNYTLRPLMKMMSKEERRELERVLGELPKA